MEGVMKIKATWVGLAVAAMAFVAAGCGDDDEGTATTTPSPTASVGVSPSPTASPEPFEGGREPIEFEGPAVPPVAILKEVRIAEHAGFDRVVFEFTDNIPGFRIEYVDPPIAADPSDMPVEIDGNAFLKIVLRTAQAHDESGNPTISGRELKPGLPSVVEAEQTGDFEGYVSWVLGLTEEQDFRVSELSGPYRIVVDVAHP
jgi:hypothetical protein